MSSKNYVTFQVRNRNVSLSMLEEILAGKPEEEKKRFSPIKKKKKKKKKDRGNFSRYPDKLKSQRQEKRNSEHGHS